MFVYLLFYLIGCYISLYINKVCYCSFHFLNCFKTFEARALQIICGKLQNGEGTGKAYIDGQNKLRKWIEDRGLKRTAFTNTTKGNAEVMISIVGMSDFCQCVILGSDCNRSKPFPDPYLKALEMLDISKDQTLICEVWLLYDIVFW